MTSRKPDAAEIDSFLRQLADESWLGPARSLWPKYLFRFDDVEGAAAILNSGRLLSRADAESQGVLIRDCANRGVIAGTPEQYKEYVRLYFRPRTPTQFNMEGFKARRSTDDPHCPMPIFFVFSAREILTRESTEFSDGNLGKSGVRVGTDCRFLRTLPFREIYHDTWFDDDERDRIVFRRHAEVMVPRVLDLDGLKYIGCRSDAEFATLLSLLNSEAKIRWRSKIGTKGQLHFRHWSFVQRVDVTENLLIIRFNPSIKDEGRFQLRVEVASATDRAVAEEPDLILPPKLSVRVGIAPSSQWAVRIELDGCLAYSGTLKRTREPT